MIYADTIAKLAETLDHAPSDLGEEMDEMREDLGREPDEPGEGTLAEPFAIARKLAEIASKGDGA